MKLSDALPRTWQTFDVMSVCLLICFATKTRMIENKFKKKSIKKKSRQSFRVSSMCLLGDGKQKHSLIARDVLELFR